MNLFRDIKSAVNKLNTIGNMTHQENFFNHKKDQLIQTLQLCTYTNQVKSAIEKSIRQVLNRFKFYRVEILQFVQNGQQKRYVELKGQLNVQQQGIVLFHIMYPANFPNFPPYIRIVNPNPAQFVCSQFYRPLQSSTDLKSYVINDKIQQVKNWKPSKQINIIVEVNNMVRTNFPFPRINKQQLMQNGMTGQFPNQKSIANTKNQNIPLNNSNRNFSQKQPPIPFKLINTTSSSAANSKMMVQNQQKILQTIKKKHQQLLLQTQLLDTTDHSIQSEYHLLIKQNENMSKFIRKNENENGLKDISETIRTSDYISQQILNLISSIKAREDSINFIQTRFKDQKISFQDFMKQIRKMEQAKFEDKALLAKCLLNK